SDRAPPDSMTGPVTVSPPPSLTVRAPDPMSVTGPVRLMAFDPVIVVVVPVTTTGFARPTGAGANSVPPLSATGPVPNAPDPPTTASAPVPSPALLLTWRVPAARTVPPV